MVKTKRLRVRLIEMLQEYGELDSAEIFGMINDPKSKFSLRHGATMASLNNVLGKEHVFVCVASHQDSDAPRCVGQSGGKGYKISLWGLNHAVLNANPELAQVSTNSYNLRATRTAN